MNWIIKRLKIYLFTKVQNYIIYENKKLFVFKYILSATNNVLISELGKI